MTEAYVTTKGPDEAEPGTLKEPAPFPALNKQQFDILAALANQGEFPATPDAGTFYTVTQAPTNQSELSIQVRHEGEATSWTKVTMGGTYTIGIRLDDSGNCSITCFLANDGKDRVNIAATKLGRAAELAWALLGRIRVNPPLFLGQYFKYEAKEGYTPRWIACQKKDEQTQEEEKPKERKTPKMWIPLAFMTSELFEELVPTGDLHQRRRDGRPLTIHLLKGQVIPAGTQKGIRIVAHVNSYDAHKNQQDNEWTMELGVNSNNEIIMTDLTLSGQRYSGAMNRQASRKEPSSIARELLATIIDTHPIHPITPGEANVPTTSPNPTIREKVVLRPNESLWEEAVEIPETIHGKEGRTADLVSREEQMEFTFALARGQFKLIRVGASDSFPGLRKMIVQPVGGTERIKYLWTARGDMYQENDWPPPGQKRGNIPIGNQTTQDTEPEEQPDLHGIPGLVRETHGPGRRSPVTAHRNPAQMVIPSEPDARRKFFEDQFRDRLRNSIKRKSKGD